MQVSNKTHSSRANQNVSMAKCLAFWCRCKEAAEVTTSGSPFEKAAGQSNAAAARRLGLHYLQRYFYLITFVVYLESSSVKEVSFARWMADRRELKHLLSTLSLEPAI